MVAGRVGLLMGCDVMRHRCNGGRKATEQSSIAIHSRAMGRSESDKVVTKR